VTRDVDRRSPNSRRLADALVLVAAVWVLLVGWLLAPAGGLLGRYALHAEEGPETTVLERIDPGLDFPVPQRLDAAYLFHWDIRRFGFPASMPPAVIHWSGWLRTAGSGRYGILVDAQGTAALRLDDRPIEISPDVVSEVDLAAGIHAIALDYSVTSGDARLVLSWRPPGRKVVLPIPSSSLSSDRDGFARAGRQRLAGWLLLLAGVAAAVAFLWAARRPENAAARLAARLAPCRSRLALGGMLVLAALLRFHDYELVPFHHETADEYQHAWEGWSLLHEGTPSAWSTFPDRYPIDQTHEFRWFGERYVMVKPYFDHPPLFSILVGAVNGLAGAPTALDCSLPIIRLVPIVLSLAGLLLLYRLGRAYGLSERATLLGALIYATLPIIVLSHRLVKAESLLALLFMGAILAVLRQDEVGGERWTVLAGILCGLSLWTKATGVAVVGVVVLLLLSRRRHRGAIVVGAISLACLGLYVLYGYAYDFGIFCKILAAQATTKWVSLDALQDLLAGKVVVKYFGRGSYPWLLLAAGCAAFRRERVILIPLAFYSVLIALTADQRVIYGWYRIPIYPFLCLAAGLYLESMMAEADFYLSFPFAATAVAAGVLYAVPSAVAQNTLITKGVMAGFALISIGPFLPRLIRDGARTRRVARAGVWLLLILFLSTSLTTVRDALEIYSASRGIR
jgi:dolichyl-phosphate-mannose-protein mannosyltransferase